MCPILDRVVELMGMLPPIMVPPKTPMPPVRLNTVVSVRVAPKLLYTVPLKVLLLPRVALRSRRVLGDPVLVGTVRSLRMPLTVAFRCLRSCATLLSCLLSKLKGSWQRPETRKKCRVLGSQRLRMLPIRKKPPRDPSTPLEPTATKLPRS